MRVTTIAVVLAILFCAAQCQANLGQSLAAKVRAVAGNSPHGLSNYISGLQSFAFDASATISTSEIASRAGITRSYRLGDGAFLGRLLRRRRIFKRVGKIFRGRSSKRGRIINVARHNAVDQTVLRFTPFQDLNALKFATSYHKLHHEKEIKSPGRCLYKATAIIGTRSGGTIHYKAGYGYSFGAGIAQVTSHTTRVCKKKLFWKKCKNVVTKVNRGLTPQEQELISEGLSHNLFTKMAAKLQSSGRLLRGRENRIRFGHTSTFPAFDPSRHEAFQHAKGVSRQNLVSAISSLVGKELTETDSSKIRQNKPFILRNDNGQKHRVQVTGDKKLNINVWTLRVLQ